MQQLSKDMLNKETEKCLFKTELMLETDMLCFEPAEAEFHSTIAVVLAQFQQCTRAVPNLLPDSFFHSFTRSLVKEHSTECSMQPTNLALN